MLKFGTLKIIQKKKMKKIRNINLLNDKNRIHMRRDLNPFTLQALDP